MIFLFYFEKILKINLSVACVIFFKVEFLKIEANQKGGQILPMPGKSGILGSNPVSVPRLQTNRVSFTISKKLIITNAGP